MAPEPNSAESTNWLAAAEQQFWFDRFASPCDQTAADGSKLAGLKFQQFQSFLKAVLYDHFRKFPPATSSDQDEHRLQKQQQQHHQNGHERDDRDQQTNEVALNRAMVSLKLCGKAEECPAEFSKQQEMHLFRKFDLNNDHLIEWEEFAQLCQKWLNQVFNPACGLVVVDVQNDFIDGSLALINGPARQDGADVIPVVNSLIEAFQAHSATIVYTLDWHPQDHVSFHANLHLRKHTLKEPSRREPEPDSDDMGGAARAINGQETLGSQPEAEMSDREFKYKRFVPKANLFDTVLFDEGRVEQKLWPIHCVRNSWGAQFHPKLMVVPDSIRVQKGTLPDVDSYSAFWDNMRVNETGLRQELANKQVTDLFFCGLATDYCVAASALDSIKAGFITFVIDDACRGIDEQEIERRRQELMDHGGFLVNSDLVFGYLRHDIAEHSTDGLSSKRWPSRTLIKAITYRKAFC